MAVYEHSYKPYEGALTSGWSRLLVMPRYAYQDLFKYRAFTALFVVCYVAPLIFMSIIYLHHNTGALQIMQLSAAELISINNLFFSIFLGIQVQLAFLFTVIIGPVLISRDLSNNALPLYLSRPLSRFEYVFGKMLVLVILLSLITWAPGMFLFFFQAFLEGGGWFRENLWIGTAIMVSSLTAIGGLSLLSMALSAWIKWRTAASAALFAIFIIPTPIGFIIQGLFNTTKGHLLNPGAVWSVIAWDLFGVNEDITPFSPGEAWMVFAVFALICFYMLWRKVRAYEVIS
jgi:ABC-2 type transport system permease protein